MPDVGISAYQFSVKVSHKDEFLNLSNKFEGKDFLDILNEGLCRYLKQLQKKRQEELGAPENTSNTENAHTVRRALEPGEMIQIDTVKKDERNYYKYVYFTVRCGEFGSRIDIENMKTGGTEFIQEPHHAGMRPYHVILAMSYSPEAKHGIIVFERIGASGVKSIFVPNLNKFLGEQIKNVVLKVNPFIQLEYFEKLLNSYPIEKMKLIKYFEVPDRGNPPFCTREERIFTRPLLQNVKNTFINIANTGKINHTGIAVIDNFMPQCLGITLDVQGKSKTIELTDIENVSFTEYFSGRDGIIFDKGNLPTDDSLLPILRTYIEERIDSIS